VEVLDGKVEPCAEEVQIDGSDVGVRVGTVAGWWMDLSGKATIHGVEATVDGSGAHGTAVAVRVSMG